MPTYSLEALLSWRGSTAFDRLGEKLGKIGELYLDGTTDVPAYASVRTGLLGRHESIVPLAGAEERDGEIHLPFDAELVRSAPSLDPDAALDPDEEHALDDHYGGRTRGPVDEGTAVRTEKDDTRTVGGDRDLDSDRDLERDRDLDETRSRDDDRGRDEDRSRDGDRGLDEGGGRLEEDGSMVRSEEELRFGASEKAPVERVRLKKVTVTDHVETTVPRRREVVQLETEPAPDGTIESVEDAGEPEDAPPR